MHVSPPSLHADGGGLPLTGERTLPGLPHENYWFRRHEVVYERVAALCTDAVVLDAGCGEGYGAHGLARIARRVVGVDYDVATVGHAARSYPDVDVVRGNLVQLPFRDAVFDVVVSLQTIEHLWDQPRFVSECARVVRPGGAVVLSTPNTLTFPPGNPCHPHELDAADLTDVVSPVLQLHELLGLRHAAELIAWEDEHGSIVDAQLADAPDAWAPTLADRVADVTVADFAFHDGDLDSTLDLVAIARRPA